MTERVEMVLRTTFYYVELNGTWTVNEKVTRLSRRGLMAELETDKESLKGTDDDLVLAYEEAISYLENISDDTYYGVKAELLEGALVPD